MRHDPGTPAGNELGDFLRARRAALAPRRAGLTDDGRLRGYRALAGRNWRSWPI